MTVALGTRARYQPSPIFGALLAATVGLGVALWRGAELGGVGVFAFVLIGWTVSLTLHEFAHAAVAFASGDRSVADKGYLTLDIRHYVEPGLSLVFPLLILVMGGVGLPGGAVWINMGAIRSPNLRSLVSVSGPAANLLCAVVCLVPIRLGLFDGAHPRFLVAMGFLGALQVIALFLNMIPIPGLDGYGVLEPHLSPATRLRLRPLGRYGIFILIGLLWYVDPVGDAFWRATERLSDLLGGEGSGALRAAGWWEFRFWRN